MKMLTRFIITVMTALMMCGCVKNEFSIEFRLAQDINSPFRTVYYASDPQKGWIVETVADVKQGKGIVDGATRLPTFVFVFSPMSGGSFAVLYATRGDDFEISGPSANPLEWEISGNDITESLSQWRLDNRQALASGNWKKINEAVEKTVKEDPSSPIAISLLTIYYSRRNDEQGFIRLRESITPEALEDKDLIRALACADIPDGILSSPGTLVSFRMHAWQGKTDTITIKGHMGALLAFRDISSGFSVTSSHDSLRSLAADTDLKKYILADICLDADSTGWIRSTRSDSLPGIRRGWLPRGLADSTAMHLGVRRLPFYIVVDANGSQTYRGSDISEASAAFRKISLRARSLKKPV